MLGGTAGGGLGGLLGPSINNSSSANLGPNGQISLSGPNQANSQQASAVLQQLSPLVQALKSLGYNVPTVGATFGTKTGIQTGISGFDEVHYGSDAEAVAGTAQRLVDVLGKLNPGIKTFADLLGNVDKLTPTLKDTKATFDSLSGVFTTTQANYQTLSKALMSADVSVTDVTKRFDQLGAAIIGAQIGKAGESISAFLASGVKAVSDFASAYSTLSTMYQTAITEARAAHQAFTPITNDFSALAKQLQGPELQAALSGLTNSFKSLQPGQYAAALDQIGQVFNSIFAQASQFNVAGSDIWNTQDQAKANLRTAFNSQISDLILGFTNPAALAIKQEKAAGDARVADAKAIGANVTEVNKLNALSLQKVIDSTKTLTTASTAAAASVQDLAAAIAQLKGGSLSGLSPGKQAQAGYNTFEDLYSKASMKDAASYQQLGQQATSTIQDYQTAYGNAPITEAIREIVLAQLQKALAAGGPGFATGSVSCGHFCQGAEPARLCRWHDEHAAGADHRRRARAGAAVSARRARRHAARSQPKHDSRAVGSWTTSAARLWHCAGRRRAGRCARMTMRPRAMRICGASTPPRCTPRRRRRGGGFPRRYPARLGNSG